MVRRRVRVRKAEPGFVERDDRSWQTAHIRQAFELVRLEQVPPVVGDALRQMSQAIQASEASTAAAAAAPRVKRRASIGDLYARTCAMIQPITNIVTGIFMAVSGPSLYSWVNRDDTAMQGIEWLFGNALLYGVSGLGLIVFAWNRLPDNLRGGIAFLMGSLLLAVVSIIYVGTR